MLSTIMIKRTLRPLGPSNQIRGIKKITVTSPRGIKMLNVSRKVLIGIGVFYGAGIAVAAGTYFYTTYTLEKIQPIPKDWTFKQKLLGLAGANHHEEQRYKLVCTYYDNLINQLLFEKDGKMIDISKKDDEWLAAYSDVIIRLGLSQAMLGQRDDSIEALNSGLSMPYGQSKLKARASSQLGQYELEDGNIARAEVYYKSAAESVKKSDPYSEEAIDANLSLGRIYAQQKRYKEALSLFLSLHKSLEDQKKADDFKCYLATAKSYISEVLWAIGNKRDALIWSEGSYYESNPKSRESVECGLCAQMAARTTSTIYKNMKMPNEAEKYASLAENQYILAANPNRYESIWASLL